MQHLRPFRILGALLLLACAAHGQTVKMLGYNTNSVVLGPTNTLVFTNPVILGGDIIASNSFLTFGNNGFNLEEGYLIHSSATLINWSSGTDVVFSVPVQFDNSTNAAVTRTNLALPWTGLTNTNAANFQAALFSTNTAPADTTNAAVWVTLKVGTNTYRLPCYQ